VARRPDGATGGPKYVLGFTFTALILGGLTLFLVLVVLPRRYVLNAGFRESGVSFPSEAAPFVPPEEERVAAIPLPPPPAEPTPGPAEVFWAEVEPLLTTGRYGEALPLFESYLDTRPGDRGVLREYAITLTKAGRPAGAVTAFRRLMPDPDYPGVRLLLARTLRDMGRIDEASEHYRSLLRDEPDDKAMALEWARALAWAKAYDQAAQVLTTALADEPRPPELQVELAQILYWAGRLDDAADVLDQIEETKLEEAGGATLRTEVLAALNPPEPADSLPEEESVPPTPLELAVMAFSEGDSEGAAVHYREALADAPADTATWRAFANLLQYELEDLEGAREALLELEARGGSDEAILLRLAQLDVWTGRNADAVRRLQELLASAGATASMAPPSDSARFGLNEAAEARALLGDLYRWDGDRTLSGEAYETALEADSTNLRARAGMEELETEITADVEGLEQPRAGADAFSLLDSDDFSRVDMGGVGVTLDGPWVWGIRAGRRWMGGVDLAGAEEEERGFYLEMETARWWFWGTVRTGVHFGVEDVRPDATDYSFGASLHFSELVGFRTDLRFDHGLAYPLTVSLQSVLGEVRQDRWSANLARQLGQRWSLSMAGDAAWLKARNEFGDGSLRLEFGGSLGRALRDDLVVGVNGRVLGYSSASPVIGDVRLFWDPRSVLAGGVYARWERDLDERWNVRGQINPSYAWIDERARSGSQAVPHLSAELGFSHRGNRLNTTLDAFYYQGRFDGYRAYGLRFSVSALNQFRKGGRP